MLQKIKWAGPLSWFPSIILRMCSVLNTEPLRWVKGIQDWKTLLIKNIISAIAPIFKILIQVILFVIIFFTTKTSHLLCQHLLINYISFFLILFNSIIV